MKTLQTYLNSLTPLQQSQYATRCGTTVNYLRTAISRKIEFRSALCIALEKQSQGEVRCEDLVPNADWAHVRKVEGV